MHVTETLPLGGKIPSKSEVITASRIFLRKIYENIWGRNIYQVGHTHTFTACSHRFATKTSLQCDGSVKHSIVRERTIDLNDNPVPLPPRVYGRMQATAWQTTSRDTDRL